ncbi:hypothetical protein ACFL27_27825, partial [candidate division CSSED10-310 bacterium]
MMTEQIKPASSEAIFRYIVVSQVISHLKQGYSACQAIKALAKQEHHEVGGQPRRISERTLHRWLAAFHKAGIVGLEPSP